MLREALLTIEISNELAPAHVQASPASTTWCAKFGLPQRFITRLSEKDSIKMKMRSLLFSTLIGAVASARSMTPMASLAAARLAGRRTTGKLFLLERPLFKFGALAMGVGELFGDKMKSAPDRTVVPGLLARVMSAGIAGAALAPHGQEKAGAALAAATAVPLAYTTLAARKRAMARIGQTRSGLIEDALIVAAGAAIVALATREKHGFASAL
jgi:uncharacterized membrane protein